MVKRLDTKLHWLGWDTVHRTVGTVEGLMYIRSEDDEHKEQQSQTTTLDASKPSPIPFTTSPQSALLSLPSSRYHLCWVIPTTMNIVHR